MGTEQPGAAASAPLAGTEEIARGRGRSRGTCRAPRSGCSAVRSSGRCRWHASAAHRTHADACASSPKLERNHRSNFAGIGVLSLEFAAADATKTTFTATLRLVIARHACTGEIRM
ncbi:MAG: hypothetical protein IPF66_02385 [Holophagales bacterium]|nr:hypothetical protein [Holophagales bacterium]